MKTLSITEALPLPIITTGLQTEIVGSGSDLNADLQVLHQKINLLIKYFLKSDKYSKISLDKTESYCRKIPL